MILFLKLLIAHMIGDFFLQPGKWIQHKERHQWKSMFLYLHTFIHLVLILVITLDLSMWKTALLLTASHLVIDGIKLQFQKQATKRTWFFIDQALHIGMILLVCSTWYDLHISLKWLYSIETMACIAALLFLFQPASFIIKNLISRWIPTAGPGTPAAASLQNAGQWIGCMERTLVFIFILSGHWEGVGFLLAAKSIFRFGDLKQDHEMKLTEYVLIGTLLSFGIAIITGLAVTGLLLNK